MTTITIPRETFDQMQRALEVLNSLDADINFLNTNELEEMLDKALSAAKAVQGEVDYKRGFNDGMNEAPTGECWIRAIDEAMVGAHIGVADMGDDYGTAKEKLNTLICWSVQVDRDLSTPQASEPAWRDIATAPKDGTAILGAWPSYIGAEAVITTCRYLGRYWVTTDYMHTEVAEPIYWMPLPSAPKATK